MTVILQVYNYDITKCYITLILQVYDCYITVILQVYDCYITVRYNCNITDITVILQV